MRGRPGGLGGASIVNSQVRVISFGAFGTYAVAGFGFGVTLDVCLYPDPATVFVPDLFAHGAHGKDAFQGLDLLEGFFEFGGPLHHSFFQFVVGVFKLFFGLVQLDRPGAGGKGRHAANLNFCDCFAYALSRTSAEPLLFKGSDFAQTDVGRAGE